MEKKLLKNSWNFFLKMRQFEKKNLLKLEIDLKWPSFRWRVNIIVDVLLHILLKFRQPFLLRMLKLLPLTACRVRQRSQYHPLLDGFLWIIAGPVAAVSFLPPVLIHLGGLGRAMVEYEEMSKKCYSTTMSFSSPRTQPSLELLNNVE